MHPLDLITHVPIGLNFVEVIFFFSVFLFYVMKLMSGLVSFFEAQTVGQSFYGIFININIYKVLQDKKKQKRENKAIGSTYSGPRKL